VSAIVESVVDPGIPSLSAVLDRVELCRILHELRCSHDGESRELQLRVLRHHAGKRCVFEIVQPGDSPRAWIGKVFAADRADVYRTMEAMRRSGFGPEAEFSIPEPIAYLPELRFLLQEKVAGRPATELFLAADEDERQRIARRCGEWLARLHTMAPLSGPVFDLAQYQLSIERWSHWIDGVGGTLADRAVELRKQLEHAIPRICDIGMRTCHGSFTHHQVIAANARIVTFDWDDHVLADPGYDVARFIVGLWRLALRNLPSIRSLDRVADVFLNTYRARYRSALPRGASASGGTQITANLAFYGAAICLRLAKKDVRNQSEQWPEKAEATLDEGLRILKEGM
jgi:aminoglycoside phosphotransferase (APT) family kinase protein